ncbi:MAG: hypothetical protein HPY74_02870 [Firmicutes bacterium]|nr:hypothetical protein [Bacillota bacterium]
MEETLKTGSDKNPKMMKAPQNTLQLIWFILKSMIKNFPKMIVRLIIFSILSFLLVYFLNIYVIAVKNEGWRIELPESSPWYWLLNLGNNQAAFSALCLFFFYFLSTIIQRIIDQGFKVFFLEMIGIPGYIIKCIQGSKKTASAVFFLAMGLSMLLTFFSSYSRNKYLMFTLAFGFLMTFSSQYNTFPHIFLTFLWNDLQRVFRKKEEPSQLNPYALSMIILGLFLGFVLLGVIRKQPLIPILVSVICFVLAFLILRGKMAPKTAAAIFFFTLTCFILHFLGREVLADDGGLQEAGGTWQSWNNSPGANEIKQLGVKPGLLGSAGSLLGSIFTSAKNAVTSAAEATWSGVKYAGGKVVDGAIYVGSKIKEGASYVGGKIKEGADYVKSTVSSAYQTTKEFVRDLTDPEILSQTWKNIKQDFAEAATQIKEFTGNTWDKTKELAYDIYNNPGKYWEGFKQTVQDALNETWQIANEIYNDPRIIVDTFKNSAETVWNIGKNIADGIYTTLTDPKKAWEFAKDALGINNFSNSIDPNRSLIDRISQVGIGVAKLYTTLTGAQMAASAGKKIMEQGLKQTFKNLADDIINFTKDPRRYTRTMPGAKSQYISKGAGNTTWMPKNATKTIQKVAEKEGVQIYVRYGNPASRKFIESGAALPKPMIIKNKTINKLDTLLGAAKENEGLVGCFKPKWPPKEVINKMRPEEVTKLYKRYEQRMEEFKQFTKKAKSLVDKNGKPLIKIENGIVKDVKTGKPYAGDIDIFDIRDATGKPVSYAKHDKIIRELQKEGASVEHGALTEWTSRSDFNKKAFEGMVKEAAEGGEGVLGFKPGGPPTHSVLTGKI